MKITEYPSITEFASDNVVIADGSAGTKKITIVNAFFSMLHMASVRNHRTHFRGNNLGGSVTTEQLARIQDGTFKGLYVGDYWTIGGIRWRIADINYWKNCGDTSFTKNHLIIVPDTCLFSAQMNDTNTTEGGYVGSDMYTTHLEAAKTTITNCFGSALLTHRNVLINAVTNGRPSGYAWVDSTVELMTECMVYGHLHYSPTNDGTNIPTLYTIDKTQLALFALCPEYINIRNWYWLRDVVSSANFAGVGTDGGAVYHGASASRGGRPVFAIG